MKKKRDWIVIICLLGAIVCASLFVIGCINGNRTMNNVCKNLGFKEAYTTSSFSFCKDNEGNLHYVMFKCNLGGICTGEKITVGEVEVAP
ncbi:hypothetical protein CCP1ISM_60007 [Azospirillaceae bacterium]